MGYTIKTVVIKHDKLTMLSFSSMLRTPPLSNTGIRLIANTAALSGGIDILGPKKT